jgi:threonine dehydrogenase-like Zn-dependent dehydrogenase
MRALRRTERGVEVCDVPRPIGDGVRVAVVAAGICGTDLANVKRGPLSVTLGHEIAGVLDDGQVVAVEPMHVCGVCQECVAGEYHLCQDPMQRWIGGSVDGGMAEEVVVPERSLVFLPDGVAARDGCLVEPLAGALHGLRVAGGDRAERVAVVGGGTMGLCAVAGATETAREVSLSARHPHQQAVGQLLGATPISGHYDLVVDSAGSSGSLARAAEMARPGGTICALAKYDNPTLPVSPATLMHKELRLVSPVAYCRGSKGRDIDVAAQLLADRPELPRALITHRFSLEQGPEAFAAAHDRVGGSIKVVIHPPAAQHGAASKRAGR